MTTCQHQFCTNIPVLLSDTTHHGNDRKMNGNDRGDQTSVFLQSQTTNHGQAEGWLREKETDPYIYTYIHILT